MPFFFFSGLQLSSQLLSDLKRASTINKAYRMRYSATEEELLQSISTPLPEQGNLYNATVIRHTQKGGSRTAFWVAGPVGPKFTVFYGNPLVNNVLKT